MLRSRTGLRRNWAAPDESSASCCVMSESPENNRLETEAGVKAWSPRDVRDLARSIANLEPY